jgi:hypothetical protein
MEWVIIGIGVAIIVVVSFYKVPDIRIQDLDIKDGPTRWSGFEDGCHRHSGK